MTIKMHMVLSVQYSKFFRISKLTLNLENRAILGLALNEKLGQLICKVLTNPPTRYFVIFPYTSTNYMLYDPGNY